MKRLVFAFVVAAMVAIVIACGGSPTNPNQKATLSVSMTDSPFSDAKALLVTISEVSAHASGGGWFTVTSTARTCDLKRLTCVQDILAAGQLPAGHYTQIRLTVSSAKIYFNAASAGASACAATPGAGDDGTLVTVSSGQLILNREFDLADGSTTSLLLDFAGDPSVVQTGNGAYRMTPVISIVTVH